MATNYGTVTNETMTSISINAGGVNIHMSANNANYMDILQQLAKMICENNPITLLDKLKKV